MFHIVVSLICRKGITRCWQRRHSARLIFNPQVFAVRLSVVLLGDSFLLSDADVSLLRAGSPPESVESCVRHARPGTLVSARLDPVSLL